VGCGGDNFALFCDNFLNLVPVLMLIMNRFTIYRFYLKKRIVLHGLFYRKLLEINVLNS
jgi:hypothetical protein